VPSDAAITGLPRQQTFPYSPLPIGTDTRTMPRLTVIMPAKNAAATIASALRSTLRAAPADAEIVVWDDGSSDATAEVAEAFGSPKVRIYRSELSVGSGAARRSLMDLTDSEFVANMDADDVSLPWRFRLQLRQIQRADLVFSPSLRFTESWRSVRLSQPLPVRVADAQVALLLGNPYPHSSMFGRRSAICAAGGYRNLRRAQDYDLWLRCASIGLRLMKHTTPVCAYRQSPHQISAQPGYKDAVWSDERLRESYRSLYLLTRDFSKPDGRRKGAVNAPDGTATLNDLESLIDVLPPVARSYYRRLQRNGNIHVPE
jgi:glycosyltransferase involved in cell wall biosynthesis